MAKLKPPVSAKDQFTGNTDSKIILVEYGDYQCPHCSHAYPLVKKLLKEEGRFFLFVFRNFPLQEVHPQAFMAAVSAEAAGLQGKFWQMHDIIFENQQLLNDNIFLDFARSLKLDLNLFLSDIKNTAILAKVENDFESGIRSGVNGTPSFFINGSLLPYDATYESLLDAVKAFK
jgi:protein-disulfide isomerase